MGSKKGLDPLFNTLIVVYACPLHLKLWNFWFKASVPYFLMCYVGGMMSMVVKSKTEDSVKCEVVDGGELKSRRHLNVRGKSATLPSITGQNSDY